MIKIENHCPVCGSHQTFNFSESDRGDDLPEDGPWTVPCEVCCGGIADAFTAISTENTDYVYSDFLLNCQRGGKSSIAIARAMIALADECAA